MECQPEVLSVRLSKYTADGKRIEDFLWRDASVEQQESLATLWDVMVSLGIVSDERYTWWTRLT